MKKTKYQMVDPGLYFSGIGTNYEFKLIYILSRKFMKYDKGPYGISEWSGIEYRYFNFKDNRIYTVNENWTDLIDSLRQVADKDVIAKAKNTMLGFVDCEKKKMEFINEIEEAIARE